MYNRSSVFLDVTQCGCVVIFRRFGKDIDHKFKRTIEDGTNMLSQNVNNYLQIKAA
jgi:hypothetical protein